MIINPYAYPAAGGGGGPSGSLVTDGLAFRLEAESIVATGTDVTSWDDLTVTGYDLTASGTPQVGSTPGGEDCVVISGTGDYLERGGSVSSFHGSSSNSDRTHLIVAKFDGVGWNGCSYGRTSGTRPAYGISVDTAGKAAIRTYGTDLSGTTSVDDSTWRVFAATHTDTGSTRSLYIDDTLEATDAQGILTYAGASTKIRVGRDVDGTAATGMSVAAWCIYTRVLDASELTEMNNYLTGKYL